MNLFVFVSTAVIFSLMFFNPILASSIRRRDVKKQSKKVRFDIKEEESVTVSPSPQPSSMKRAKSSLSKLVKSMKCNGSKDNNTSVDSGDDDYRIRVLYPKDDFDYFEEEPGFVF